MRGLIAVLALVVILSAGMVNAGEIVMGDGHCHNGRCNLLGAAATVIKAPIVAMDRLIDRPCEKEYNVTSCDIKCGGNATISDCGECRVSAGCGEVRQSGNHHYRRGFIVRRRCR